MIKCNYSYVFFKCVFCNSFIYCFCCIDVTGVFYLFMDCFFYSRSGGDNFRVISCNYLCVYMMRSMVYYQVSCIQFCNFMMCMCSMMDVRCFFIYSVILFFFSFFIMYIFICVMNIFVFVRFRCVVRMNVSCNLINYLFVVISQDNFSLVWIFCFNICWQFVFNRVREIQSQVYSVVFYSSMVINIFQNEFFSKVFSNINNYIFNKSMCSICLCLCIGYVFMWIKSQLVVFLCDYYIIVENVS